MNTVNKLGDLYHAVTEALQPFAEVSVAVLCVELSRNQGLVAVGRL